MGKTSICENLACLIENNDVPRFLLKKQIVALDMMSMIAGTQWRGMLEERIKGLIKDFNDIKWRTERVPKYLFNHPELGCTQQYHLPDICFRVENNIIILVDVDTSRPWTILDYDGAEYIQYLDFDIIDTEINYCELKKE